MIHPNGEKIGITEISSDRIQEGERELNVISILFQFKERILKRNGNKIKKKSLGIN